MPVLWENIQVQTFTKTTFTKNAYYYKLFEKMTFFGQDILIETTFVDVQKYIFYVSGREILLEVIL